MVFTKSVFIFAALMAGMAGGMTSVPAKAQAAELGRIQVFGQDRFGNTFVLPRNLCAFPGQTVRLALDSFDARGFRLYLPVDAFYWEWIRAGEQGGSSQPRIHLPLPHDVGTPAYGSVFVHFPVTAGVVARLDVSATGHLGDYIRFIDPRANTGVPCVFAHNDVYFWGMPTNPPNTDPSIGICNGQCQVGARCLDGCPWVGACKYIRRNVLYWQTVSCPSTAPQPPFPGLP